jgi:hypothetical protein
VGNLFSESTISHYCARMPTYLAGCAIMWKSSLATYKAPLAGFYLLGFFSIIYVMILVMISANTAGHTKKALKAGLVWAAYCAGNGISPLLVKNTKQRKRSTSPLCSKRLSLLLAQDLCLPSLSGSFSRARISRGTSEQ